MRKKQSDFQMNFTTETGAMAKNNSAFDFAQLDDFACWAAADIDSNADQEFAGIIIQSILKDFRNNPTINQREIKEYIMNARELAANRRVGLVKAGLAVAVTDYTKMLCIATGNERLYHLRRMLRPNSKAGPALEIGVDEAEVKLRLPDYEDEDELFGLFISKTLTLRDGDVIFICNSGFWKNVGINEIYESVQGVDEPFLYLYNLKQLILLRQEESLLSYTMIAIFVNQVCERSLTKSLRTMVAAAAIIVLAIGLFVFGPFVMLKGRAPTLAKADKIMNKYWGELGLKSKIVNLKSRLTEELATKKTRRLNTPIRQKDRKSQGQLDKLQAENEKKVQEKECQLEKLQAQNQKKFGKNQRQLAKLQVENEKKEREKQRLQEKFQAELDKMEQEKQRLQERLQVELKKKKEKSKQLITPQVTANSRLLVHKYSTGKLGPPVGFQEGNRKSRMADFCAVVDGVLVMNTMAQPAAVPSYKIAISPRKQPAGFKFTVLARVKVICEYGMDFDLRAAGLRERVCLLYNCIKLDGAGAKSGILQAMDWHTYCIVFAVKDEGGTAKLETKVFVDGASEPAVQGVSTDMDRNNYFRFGDSSASRGYIGALEWIAWSFDAAYHPNLLHLPSGYNFK
jgi:hypothetical protein